MNVPWGSPSSFAHTRQHEQPGGVARRAALALFTALAGLCFVPALLCGDLPLAPRGHRPSTFGHNQSPPGGLPARSLPQKL